MATIETNYAQALVNTLEKSTTPDDAVTKLVALLRKKGHIRLLPRIKRELERLYSKRSKFAGTRVRLARKADHVALKEAINAHIVALNATEPKIIEDDTIIGGYVVETGTTMVDASYKSALMRLYRSVIS